MLQIQQTLRQAADPERAAHNARFFKSRPGEYGEGDVFLGLTVPKIRDIIKDFKNLPLSDIDTLLKSEYHEERLAAVLLLVEQFKRGSPDAQKEILEFYLAHTNYVNNWDLVDSSADKILGVHALEHGTKDIEQLAASNSLWEERIAMVATYALIRAGKLNLTFRLAEKFLQHNHDLMHKAVGWMLREAGKRDEEALKEFLDTHAAAMPRTMLRYAIEKFSKEERIEYMNLKTNHSG